MPCGSEGLVMRARSGIHRERGLGRKNEFSLEMACIDEF